MDPKRQRKMDQALAEIREATPGTWWAMYQGAVDRGFTPAQAFDLLRAHIFASNGCPVYLTATPDPDLDPPEEKET